MTLKSEIQPNPRTTCKIPFCNANTTGKQYSQPTVTCSLSHDGNTHYTR